MYSLKKRVAENILMCINVEFSWLSLESGDVGDHELIVGLREGASELEGILSTDL